MSNFISFNDFAMKAVDGFFRILPQPTPAESDLRAAKIVAHRGCHEAKGVIENSLRAFELAYKNGLWGIEFDVRWTKDEVPVVFHDRDLGRIFGLSDKKISELSMKELEALAPQIAPFDQVLHKFGKKLHLMIELKESLDTPQKVQKFKNLLAPLTPGEDFHLLGLDPLLFEEIKFLPPTCFLPVAEWNLKQLSEIALKKSLGGITGHYLLLNNTIRARHANNGQKVGTGFADSKNLLYRELNRGIDWIFTDKALTLKTLLDKALKS